ncbi:hypothetical protein PVK06_047565 [Gossypium arboreum]|uniref:Serine carboxypeptidase-like 18 n=1 Tax=Gossypium arboreum TaxID=29729 RepID=A0ABR0ME53_GOSAR|nr:hypothetical protein PVK06_047565 [Gossypium arboreum]
MIPSCILSIGLLLQKLYVGVGDSEEVQLFYYFVKSEGKPEDNPLLIWLTGGPGCSAFSGLVFEIGPLKFKVDVYNGSLPTLVYNPYAWTKLIKSYHLLNQIIFVVVSNIIFIDSPVGTGFSYARNNRAAQTGDLKQVHHLHQFLRKTGVNKLVDLVGVTLGPKGMNDAATKADVEGKPNKVSSLHRSNDEPI